MGLPGAPDILDLSREARPMIARPIARGDGRSEPTPRDHDHRDDRAHDRRGRHARALRGDASASPEARRRQPGPARRRDRGRPAGRAVPPGRPRRDGGQPGGRTSRPSAPAETRLEPGPDRRSTTRSRGHGGRPAAEIAQGSQRSGASATRFRRAARSRLARSRRQGPVVRHADHGPPDLEDQDATRPGPSR